MEKVITNQPPSAVVDFDTICGAKERKTIPEIVEYFAQKLSQAFDLDGQKAACLWFTNQE